MTRDRSSVFRILSYNVHGCIGWGGRYDSQAITDIIMTADADIVALQEVYNEAPSDQQFLDALRSLPYQETIYGVNLIHQSRGAYGNVLLSRWPLNSVEKWDLTVLPHEPRGAIRVKAFLPRGCIDLTTTHLGLRRRERALQLTRLMDFWNLPSRETGPRSILCLAGDLNEWLPRSRLLTALRKAFAAGRYLNTFPSHFPVVALDRIFVKPVSQQVRQYVLNTPATRRASDHLPLIGEIKFG